MSEHLSNGHSGSCHCGRVRIVLSERPVEVGECNCSLCRRLGGLWVYASPELVRVEGEGKPYRQGDCSLDTWHCEHCGSTTHWTAVDKEYPRMGVNVRMFDPALWCDLPRRLIDGASY